VTDWKEAYISLVQASFGSELGSEQNHNIGQTHDSVRIIVWSGNNPGAIILGLEKSKSKKAREKV
jgi:hypothetical protein